MTDNNHAPQVPTIDARSERHLTVRDLAERCGVPAETVYTWNKTRTGPPFMKIGKYCRYRLADVLAWEKSRLADQSRVA